LLPLRVDVNYAHGTKTLENVLWPNIQSAIEEAAAKHGGLVSLMSPEKEKRRIIEFTRKRLDNMKLALKDLTEAVRQGVIHIA
jgi:hypothetical protein